jgi:hypothetical protein
MRKRAKEDAVAVQEAATVSIARAATTKILLKRVLSPD